MLSFLIVRILRVFAIHPELWLESLQWLESDRLSEAKWWNGPTIKGLKVKCLRDSSVEVLLRVRLERPEMPMNLTPEQQKIGKQSFSDAVGLTRRDLLKGVAAGATGLGAMYFGYSELQGAPVKVAFIGTGDEGNILLTQHPPGYMEVVAIADLRPSNRIRAMQGDDNDDRQGLIRKLGPAAASKAL